MSRTEDLEAELRTSWSEGALAVYADHLMSLGDPRGELIALELADDPASERRRRELTQRVLAPLDVWYDEETCTWGVGEPPDGTRLVLEHGLIEAIYASDGKTSMASLTRFLAHAQGRYLHRLAIQGTAESLRASVAALTARERPWLRSVSMRRIDHGGEVFDDTAPLVTASPNLVHLELAGRRIMKRFDHAGIAELTLDGHDALALPGWPLPGVTTLDVDLGVLYNQHLHTFVTAAQFPAVRRLVLSRCEPGADMFRALLQLGICDQLAHLELPSLRSHGDLRVVQAALDRMPRLQRLHVARAYMCFGDLAPRLQHARARITVAPQWPWPPREQARIMCTVDDRTADLSTLVDILEEQHDELAEVHQTFWLRWWSMINGGVSQEVRSRELSGALDELVLDDPDWIAIREWLRLGASGFAKVSWI